MSIPKTIESELVYNEFLKIRKDLLKIDEGAPYPYYTLLTPNSSVVVLAKTVDGKFAINEEYRPPVGKFLLTCPGGFLDSGEDPLIAAKRELLEESGYTAENFTLMGSGFPFAGICGQRVFYIFAYPIYKIADPKPERSEIFSTHLYQLADLENSILAGKEVDGNLCTALFFYHRLKDR